MWHLCKVGRATYWPSAKLAHLYLDLPSIHSSPYTVSCLVVFWRIHYDIKVVLTLNTSIFLIQSNSHAQNPCVLFDHPTTFLNKEGKVECLKPKTTHNIDSGCIRCRTINKRWIQTLQIIYTKLSSSLHLSFRMNVQTQISASKFGIGCGCVYNSWRNEANIGRNRNWVLRKTLTQISMQKQSKHITAYEANEDSRRRRTSCDVAITFDGVYFVEMREKLYRLHQTWQMLLVVSACRKLYIKY